MLVHYLLIFICFFYGSTIQISDSTVWIHDVIFEDAKSDTGKINKYSFAVFNLSFDSPIKIERKNAQILEKNVFPEEFDESNPYGLIRLFCDNYVFESTTPNFSFSEIPFLFPLKSSSNTPIYRFLSLLYEPFFTSSSLLLSLLMKSSVSYLSLDQLEDCRAVILQPFEQSVSPKAILSDYLPSSNSIRFRIIENALQFNITPSMISAASSSLYGKHCTSQDNDFSSFLAEQLTVTGGGIGGLVQSVAKPVITPLGSTVGGIMSDGVGAMVGDTLSRNLEATYADTIANELSESLGPAITQVLVPSLTETVTDSLTASLSSSLRDFLTESLTSKITSELTLRLAKTISKTVPEKVNNESPKELGLKLTTQLGHLLTRSLSHTIIPSLIHTIAHSPLHDYYCFYCYHHKEYCEYCQLQPSQVYYALNYAAYYSTYISDYYTKYFSSALSKQMELQESRRKQAVGNRDEYEIVLEV